MARQTLLNAFDRDRVGRQSPGLWKHPRDKSFKCKDLDGLRGENDAVLGNAQKRVFTNPDKVHEIGRKGQFFDMPGYHLCEPSPQRTPLLHQAGASGPNPSFSGGTRVQH
jgi:alkanesulfonate monooxygenase SsuD/methylene tetrahydromethanopterin reductase-like flavin-dependent oxidoreductase (luciferase family)